MEIEEQGNKLVINLDKTPKKEATELDIKDNEYQLKYLLRGLYKRGYDSVTLRYNKAELISEIQEVLQKEIIGYEIVSHEPNKCVIKSVAMLQKKDFEIMFRRTFILLKTMSEEVLKSLINKDTASIKSLLYYESMNNKYSFFCKRILNKYGYDKDYKRINYLYSTTHLLEKLSNEYRYLINSCINHEELKIISPHIIKIYEELTEFINDAYETYYKFDIEKAIEIFKRKKELI